MCASVRHASKNRSAVYEIQDATRLIEKRLELSGIDDYDGVKDILEHIRNGIKKEQQRKVSKEKEEKAEQLRGKSEDGSNNENRENLNGNQTSTNHTENSENKSENNITTQPKTDAIMVNSSEGISDKISLSMIKDIAKNLDMPFEQALALLKSHSGFSREHGKENIIDENTFSRNFG